MDPPSYGSKTCKINQCRGGHRKVSSFLCGVKWKADRGTEPSTADHLGPPTPLRGKRLDLPMPIQKFLLFVQALQTRR